MKLARTNWIGIGCMVGTGAAFIGQWMPWYERRHWGWGIAFWAGAAAISWLLWKAETRGERR